ISPVNVTCAVHKVHILPLFPVDFSQNAADVACFKIFPVKSITANTTFLMLFQNHKVSAFRLHKLVRLTKLHKRLSCTCSLSYHFAVLNEHFRMNSLKKGFANEIKYSQ